MRLHVHPPHSGRRSVVAEKSDLVYCPDVCWRQVPNLRRLLWVYVETGCWELFARYLESEVPDIKQRDRIAPSVLTSSQQIAPSLELKSFTLQQSAGWRELRDVSDWSIDWVHWHHLKNVSVREGKADLNWKNGRPTKGVHSKVEEMLKVLMEEAEDAQENCPFCQCK